MQKHRLNVDDLGVETFETADPMSASIKEPYTIVDPNDPTAATWCFYCPPPTLEDCIL